MRPRFLVDINVGRLAKWLRILGYDAAVRPDAEDGELVRRAMADGRVLLTRDALIPQRRVVAQGRLRVILLRSEEPMAQLRQVMEDLGLDPSGAFTLCIECGARLRDRPKDTVVGLVPPYVFQTQQAFMECPACGKLYWQGTHWRNMRRKLEKAVSGGAERKACT